MSKYQPAPDYAPDDADDDATQLDREPHWSSLPRSLVQMSAAKAAPLAARPARLVPRPLPPRLPPARQRFAVTPSAPLPTVQPIASDYMLPFYAYSESQSQYGLETEHVAPLPMSALRPDWYVTLAKLWSRFAAPACGAIAGLIFVVGYLAYASQDRSALAASATPAPRIVMPVEVAVAAPASDEVRAPTIPEATIADDVDDAPTAKPVKRAVPKRIATKRVSSSGKRRALRLDDATPLGDLRPSRSR